MYGQTRPSFRHICTVPALQNDPQTLCERRIAARFFTQKLASTSKRCYPPLALNKHAHKSGQRSVQNRTVKENTFQ